MCPQNTLIYVNLCLNSVEHVSVFKESCLWCVGSWEQRYYHGCRVIYVAAEVFFFFNFKCNRRSSVVALCWLEWPRWHLNCEMWVKHLARRPLAGRLSSLFLSSFPHHTLNFLLSYLSVKAFRAQKQQQKPRSFQPIRALLPSHTLHTPLS